MSKLIRVTISVPLSVQMENGLEIEKMYPVKQWLYPATFRGGAGLLWRLFRSSAGTGFVLTIRTVEP